MHTGFYNYQSITRWTDIYYMLGYVSVFSSRRVMGHSNILAALLDPVFKEEQYLMLRALLVGHSRSRLKARDWK